MARGNGGGGGGRGGGGGGGRGRGAAPAAGDPADHDDNGDDASSHRSAASGNDPVVGPARPPAHADGGPLPLSRVDLDNTFTGKEKGAAGRLDMFTEGRLRTVTFVVKRYTRPTTTNTECVSELELDLKPYGKVTISVPHDPPDEGRIIRVWWGVVEGPEALGEATRYATPDAFSVHDVATWQAKMHSDEGFRFLRTALCRALDIELDRSEGFDEGPMDLHAEKVALKRERLIRVEELDRALYEYRMDYRHRPLSVTFKRSLETCVWRLFDIKAALSGDAAKKKFADKLTTEFFTERRPLVDAIARVREQMKNSK